MANLIGTLSALLITALTIHLGGGYTVTSPQTSSDPSPSIPAQMASAKPRPVQQPLSWNNLLKRILRRRPPVSSGPGGSRGDICPIVPELVGGTPEVWSDRPLFVWKGTALRITVHPQGSQEVLWSQTPTAADQTVTYAGTVALQPGQTYDWVVLSRDQFSRPTRTRFKFQVMEAERRDRITAELTALETSLKDKEATAEQIALQRANYFTERQLWSDVLQVAYSVENPSAELSNFVQAVPAQVCPPPKAEHNRSSSH